MRVSALAVIALLFLASAGCANQHQHYNWGSYDPSLYSYYKDPTKLTELSASLQAVIDAAAKGQASVPPGIYAEYGYLQMQQGNNQSAVELFKLEASHWPESQVFMDRMIKVASTPAVGVISGNVTP